MPVFTVQVITQKDVELSNAEYELIYIHALRVCENWKYEDKYPRMLVPFIKFIRNQHNLGLKHAKDIVVQIYDRAQACADKPAQSYASFGEFLRDKRDNNS